MKYKVAKTAGFCGGVKKAFLMVKERFENNIDSNKKVLILGSLVHNDNVMKIISRLGIEKIDSLESVQQGDVVIITAHGAAKKVFQEIEQKGAQVFDATCPKVTMVQDCAREYFEKGFQIVIFGDKQHKEVKGINGWCDNRALIVANLEEAEKLALEIEGDKVKKPVLLISQTTQNIKNFEKIKSLLSDVAGKKDLELEVVDTICRATFVRQKEALEIAKETDAVIVIGGRSSSNTKQLYKIVEKENTRTIWIEDPSELESEEYATLLKEVGLVGIISGASTSQEDIEKLKSFVERL